MRPGKFLGTAADKAVGGRDRRQAGGRLKSGLGWEMWLHFLVRTKPRVRAPGPISSVVGTNPQSQDLGGRDGKDDRVKVNPGC